LPDLEVCDISGKDLQGPDEIGIADESGETEKS